MFEFGFMLLDPSSTFGSVHANVEFLRAIVGDGSASATFCRMLPYDGTPIKDELERTGRLRGDVCAPDYDFLDPRLEDFYQALARTVDVTGWIHGHKALSPQLNWAWNEAAVMEHLFPDLPDMSGYKAMLRQITRTSNDLLFSVVDDMALDFESGRVCECDADALHMRCGEFLDRLLAERNAFVGRNQGILLKALQQGMPQRRLKPQASPFLETSDSAHEERPSA
jgi:hypothetical protein